MVKPRGQMTAKELAHVHKVDTARRRATTSSTGYVANRLSEEEHMVEFPMPGGPNPVDLIRRRSEVRQFSLETGDDQPRQFNLRAERELKFD